MSRPRGDAGAATLAAIALSLVVALGVAVAGQLARAGLAEQRTAAAADLAALSAATAIARFEAAACDAAEGIASANATDLTACDVRHPTTGPQVSVSVRYRYPVWPLPAAEASARAALRPVEPDPAASPGALRP